MEDQVCEHRYMRHHGDGTGNDWFADFVAHLVVAAPVRCVCVDIDAGSAEKPNLFKSHADLNWVADERRLEAKTTI